MSEITIYTTQTCPKCEKLKEVMSSNNVSFKVADMSTPESLTELRLNGVFTLTAPVLQIDEDFLTHDELFNGQDVNLDAISSIL